METLNRTLAQIMTANKAIFGQIGTNTTDPALMIDYFNKFIIDQTLIDLSRHVTNVWSGAFSEKQFTNGVMETVFQTLYDVNTNKDIRQDLTISDFNAKANNAFKHQYRITDTVDMNMTLMTSDIYESFKPNNIGAWITNKTKNFLASYTDHLQTQFTRWMLGETSGAPKAPALTFDWEYKLTTPSNASITSISAISEADIKKLFEDLRRKANSLRVGSNKHLAFTKKTDTTLYKYSKLRYNTQPGNLIIFWNNEFYPKVATELANIYHKQDLFVKIEHRVISFKDVPGIPDASTKHTKLLGFIMEKGAIVHGKGVTMSQTTKLTKFRTLMERFLTYTIFKNPMKFVGKITI